MDRFPRNSAELVAMRRKGEVPALPVLVTLAGPLSWSNVTLQATAGERYDWRPVAALDVEVFASASVPFGDLLATLVGIAAVVPKSMVLSFVEGPRVHCGEMRKVPGQDFGLFDWFPMAVGPSSYLEGGKLARRIVAEMGRSIPIPYDEACDLVVQLATENSK